MALFAALIIAGASICWLLALSTRRRYVVERRNSEYRRPDARRQRTTSRDARRFPQSRRNRARERSRQLASALPLVAEMLRGGSSAESAFVTVASCTADPLGSEWSHALREVSTANKPLDRALESLARKTKDKDLDVLASAMAVQKDGGGNLADVLDSIALTVQKRLEMEGHIDSITSSARLSAALVGAMPPALLALLSLASPAYMKDFWACGAWPAILGLVAVLDATGLAIIRKLYRLDLS